MDKLDFLEAYPEAWKQALTLDNIKNGFRTTGLISFNPEEVLGHFTIQLKTPTPPDSRSISSHPRTPHKLKQLKKQTTTVKKLLQQRTNSSPTSSKTALNQLIKGCELAMNSASYWAMKTRNYMLQIKSTFKNAGNLGGR